MKIGKRVVIQQSEGKKAVFKDTLTGDILELAPGTTIDVSMVGSKKEGRCRFEGTAGTFSCRQVKGKTNVVEG